MSELLITEYHLAMRDRRCSLATMNRRVRLLRTVAQRLDLATATSDELNKWISCRDHYPRSRNVFRTDMQNFYTWLRTCGVRTDNPVEALPHQPASRISSRHP
jgi:hypothetical protein